MAGVVGVYEREGEGRAGIEIYYTGWAPLEGRVSMAE